MWIVTWVTVIFLCAPLPFDGYDAGPMTLDYPEYCEQVFVLGRDPYTSFGTIEKAMEFIEIMPKEYRRRSWYNDGSSFLFKIEAVKLDGRIGIGCPGCYQRFHVVSMADQLEEVRENERRP